MSKKYISYQHFEYKNGEDMLEGVDVDSSTHVDFKDIFSPLYWDKLIETDAVLSGVSTPVDKEIRINICPQCMESSSKYEKLMDHSGNFVRGAYVCPNCSEYFMDRLYVDSVRCNIMEMEERRMQYSIQQLVFKHPDTMRTLLVGYVGDKEFLKKDIGKEYLITGKIKKIPPLQGFQYIMRTRLIEYYEHSEDTEPNSFTDSRDIPGYGEWREHILARDKVCVVCGGDKNLHAHHLFGYKENPSLRVHTENGVAVCQWCHDKYHSYYGVKQINPVDFIKFVHRFGVK